MITVNIPQREINQALRDVDRLGEIVQQQVGRLILTYLLKIETSAKENLDRTGRPGVDTGRLRASLRHAMESAAGFVAAGKVFTDTEYAVYVHEGTGIFASGGGGRKTQWVYFDETRGQFFVTRGMRPNPFLTDAFDEHINDFIRDLQQLLR